MARIVLIWLPILNAASDRSERTTDVATAHPGNLDVEQTLAFVTGREVAFRMASPSELAEKLRGCRSSC